MAGAAQRVRLLLLHLCLCKEYPLLSPSSGNKKAILFLQRITGSNPAHLPTLQAAVIVTVFSAGGDDLTEASQIRQWVVSVYFAMTTVTTVGYGDITAHSATEQVRLAGLSTAHTQYTLL